MKYALVLVTALYGPTCFAETELRDPTMPSYMANKTAVKKVVTNKTRTSANTWTLETTLADSKRIIAVINGQQVSVGDEVDGAYVMKITHQQVTLKHADMLFDIKLQQSFTAFMK